MKICLHTCYQISTNCIGGIERFMIAVAKELQLIGWEPIIVCTNDIKDSEVEGIRVIGKIPNINPRKLSNYKYYASDFLRNEVALNSSNTLDILSRLATFTMAQIEGIDADLFHFNSFASASMIDADIGPIVVTNHENDIEMGACWGETFFEDFAESVRLRKTNLHNFKLTAPSIYYSNFYSRSLDVNVLPVKMGVNIGDFNVEQTRKSRIEKPHSDCKILRILLPSRLRVKQKGHDIALKACTILKDAGLKFQLIVTGANRATYEQINSFRKQVEIYGLKDIVILGSFKDINEAYNACDIVISPERYCSYGLSISESLSLGIDTVLSDIPTYREIGEKYKHAHFFEAGDYRQMAAVIMQLSKSKDNKLDVINFRIANDIRDCAKKYSKIYMDQLGCL